MAIHTSTSLNSVGMSSPPSTPLGKGRAISKPVEQTGEESVGQDDAQLPTPLPETNGKRKHTTKGKATKQPIKNESTDAPHGLGDLNTLLKEAEKPAARRSTRSKTVAKAEEKNEAENVKEQKPQKTRAPRKTKAIKVDSSGGNMKDEDIKDEPPKKTRAPRKSKAVNAESPVSDVKGDDAKEEPAKKTRAPRKSKDAHPEPQVDNAKDEGEQVKEEKPNTKRKRAPAAEDTSDDFLEKPAKNKRATRKNASDNNLSGESEKPAKKERQKKNPYGLTPGFSPYPDHVKPTLEDCEEVNRLLTELHGEHKAPAVIPAPSTTVSGCGEVPDLLDGLLRTRLSATTSGKNAALALQGLVAKFGTRTSGSGAGSVNWDAVHEADLETVIDSIKRGGLAKIKGKDIKEILRTVYERNAARRDALLKEKETGESADVTGAGHETRQQKDAELARFSETLINLDYILEMTTDEAMDEMVKLPGIGPKTASCVILFRMQRPSFAVDTHVFRHCKWLGWVPEKATEIKTFSHCEVRIPDHLKYSLHQLFIQHGKNCYRCRGNTSYGTEEWNNTICPIEHLVTRTGRKLAGHKAEKRATETTSGGTVKKSKRSKNADDDSGESEIDEVDEEDEMSEVEEESQFDASS